MLEFKDAWRMKTTMREDYYLLFHETSKFLYYMSKSKLVLKKRKAPGLTTRTDITSNSINVSFSKSDRKKFDLEKIYKEKFIDYKPKIFTQTPF
jgi:hypothetical protein